MRNNTAIRCGVLLLLLLVLLTGQTFAAEPDLQIIMPETLPNVGETFTVTVNITGNPGLCAVQYTLAYDHTRLVCEAVSTGEVLLGTMSAVNTDAGNGAVVAAATTSPATGDGTIGVFTFRVLQNEAVRLTVQDHRFRDAEGTAVYLDAPSAEAVPAGSAADKMGTDIPASQEETTESAAPSLRFSDVPRTFWGYDAIERAAELGYVVGVGNGCFAPERALTRAEFVTMLWRMRGKPQTDAENRFDDVAPSDWYYEAVCWAADKDLVTGVAASRFSPDGIITRQEVATILYRMDGSRSGLEISFRALYDRQYSDSGSIASWARAAMDWAVYHGVLSGTSATTLHPTGTATRAAVATILVRYTQSTASGV